MAAVNAATSGVRRLAGIGVSHGIAFGPVAWLAPPPSVPDHPRPSAGVAQELHSAQEAMTATAEDLQSRSEQATGAGADVLSAQAMMAMDPVLGERIASLITEGSAAPAAATRAFNEFRTMLLGAGGYMAERASDLDDVRNRVVCRLLGLPMPGVPHPGHPFVLLARDLAPADTVGLDPTQVLAIVTEQGGPTSHTAIIAKSLGLPAVVACPAIANIEAGTLVMVDGAEGLVEIDPDPAALSQRQSRRAAQQALAGTHSGPGRTRDGVSVQLLINLGSERDLATAGSVDAEGVGLYRTEFLFLERPDAPRVDEQVAAYGEVFCRFGGRKVVVRTLDAGADKPLRFVTQPDEPNPALGIRGLRTSRRFPALLADQLQAIALAAQAHEARVWVMAPMVSTPAEGLAFTTQAHSHGLAVAGAMVEVPAAALRARDLVAGCDFLSIGTNDLSQYTFAADRMAGELAELLDPWQPALLDLIRITADACKAAGRPLGACGEAASDPLLALVLAGLGADSLSMSPVSIPEVRLALASHTMAECRSLACDALGASSAAGARRAAEAASHQP